MEDYLALTEKASDLKGKIKVAEDTLDKQCLAKYSKLTEKEVKELVVDVKWMGAISKSVGSEMDRVSQRLTQRVKELIERYESPLPVINKEVEALEIKVNVHLAKMGFSLV
jgi:type I restriction enzyme M protein